MAESISESPQLITYSGLAPGGSGSYSGVTQQGAGGISGTQPGVLPGMEGGLSLAELQQLLQSAQADGVEGSTNVSPLLAAIGQGGIGAGSFGQAGGYSAGQSAFGSRSGATAGQGSSNTVVDPLVLVQKLLGITKTAVGIASPSAGDAESGQSAPTPIESPLISSNADYSAVGGSDTYGGAIAAEGGAQGLRNLLPQSGTLSPTEMQSYFSSLGVNLSPDEISQLTGGLEQTGGGMSPYAAGPGSGVGETNTLSPSAGPATGPGTGGLSGQGQLNPGGALQGGIGGVQGLLNLFQGLQGGNIAQGVGGGLQTTAGLTKLLQSYPELASGLGLDSGTLGPVGAGIGGLGGLLGLAGGVQSGDAGRAAMGGLQTIGGATSLLQSSPELAGMLGLDAGGAALSGIGGAVGGIGGLYSLYQGIESGNPVQAATGALSAYMGGASLYGAITGTTAPGILTGLATIAPQSMAAIASAISGTTVSATAGAAPIASAISAAAAAYALPVAAIVIAVMDTIAQKERDRVMNAGFTNNPIKGALYSNSTRSVGNVNEMLSGGSDLAGMDTAELGRMLSYGANNLMPYYQTAQGGRGAIRASDTITGVGADWAAKPYEGGLTPEAYTQNFTNARTGVAGLVQELMKRGVTYEQLGQLPISGDWASASLDAGNTPHEMMMRNYATPAPGQTESRWAEGKRLGYSNNVDFNLSGGAGSDALGDPWGLNAVLGASMIAPAEISKASGSMTGMYGGPLWAAMARMGVPELMPLINQNFDPWVNARNPAETNPYASSIGTDPSQAMQQAGDTWEGISQQWDAAHPPPAPAPNFWAQLAQQQQAPMMQQQMDPAMMQQLMQMANSPQASTAGQQPMNSQMGMIPQFGASGSEESLLELLRRIGPSAAYGGA